ncbi:UNVERIFIED_ORG: outer membrane efflux protein [Herbaspirillum seropedicae]
MHISYACRLCLAVMATLTASSALSQSASLNLSDAVQAAWRLSPQARTLEAKRNEMQAGLESARTWVAGSPVLGLSQRSDRWTDRNGAKESEVSISAPLWLPAHKAAREAVAQSNNEDLEAQIAVARLALAGEVRERLWTVAAARESLAEASDHQGHLEALTEEVMRRVKAGDLARSDGMLARQEVLAAQSAVANARAKEQEALMRYRVLTGQTEIPSNPLEPLAAAVSTPHPRALAAIASLQRSKAALKAADAIRSDPPTVGLLMRKDQGGSGDSSRTIGVAIQIPIGTSARNRPLEAAARTQSETAAAELSQADLLLQAETDLARQQLLAAQESWQRASERAALTREHATLIGKSFRAGERGLADLLRAQALAHEADTAERQQKVAVGLAHARVNQALGIIP